MARMGFIMGDACENLHLARTVNRGGIVELAGETVEKAFEDEDGHPVRRERQDQREKGVEQRPRSRISR